MTPKAFVGQMDNSKVWATTTTDELHKLLAQSLTGIRKSEIQEVKAVLGSRRARRARALAAQAISYETLFTVVPDYSEKTPAYMEALGAKRILAANSTGMSVKDKLINELATIVNGAVKEGSFASGALKALQAAAKDGDFAKALAAAGAPADAISKLKASDLAVSQAKLSDGYGGAAFTTDASYTPVLATTTEPSKEIFGDKSNMTATASAPYKINLAVPIKFSADIGNMTPKAFVGQMDNSKVWATTTTDELHKLLAQSLTGIRKSEIQEVKAVLGSRRARRARALAAQAISYETLFTVVPDYSEKTPAYMEALGAKRILAANSTGMSVKDKLINELATIVNGAVKEGSFASGALKALQAAAKDGDFAKALAAAGAPADAISKLKASDLAVSQAKLSDGYGGAAFTTDASYTPVLATTTATSSGSQVSNAVAAGIAALLASVALL